jgi:hypothetical protein
MGRCLPPPQGAGRVYVKDNRVSAAEMAELVAQGHAHEASYFLSIGKAQVPAGWSAGDGGGGPQSVRGGAV